MTTLTKQNLDWAKLGFGYVQADYRFNATFENGEWDPGELTQNHQILVHEGATALHYAQSCFEGMKAQTAKDGRVLLFRPELNAKRMQATAERIVMPQVPIKLFMHGVHSVVRANYSWIPPYGSGSSLYIRPILYGDGENLGLRPAPKYQFRVMVSPVGPYFQGDDLKPICLVVTDFDRAAPNGTGAYKVSGNYAGSLFVSQHARKNGADEALYLDPKNHRYLDEAGAANMVILFKNQRLVTPGSKSILPSITRQSVMELAQKQLNLTTETRKIDFLEEVNQFEEVAGCGTAAVIVPIGTIKHQQQSFTFYNDGQTAGPITRKLYAGLVSIQQGATEDVFGWTQEVKIS